MQVEQFRAYIERVMSELELTPTEIARKAGMASTTVTRPIYKPEIASAPTLRTISKIVQATGIPFEVEGRAVFPDSPSRSVEVEPGEPQALLSQQGQVRIPINLAALPYDLPIFPLRAIPTRSDSTRMEEFAMQEDATEYCRRPPGLAGVASAYATYAPTDAVFKYEKNELMVVAPDRPVRPGDIVLLTVQKEGGDAATVFGRLEDSTKGWIEIVADRPKPMVAKFATDTVLSTHKVLTMSEALGF